MWQVVSDIGKPAWDIRDVDCAAFGVITVLCASYGLVECLAAETGVDAYWLAKVLTQRFKHLLTESLQVIHFFRCDAVFYLFLLSGLAVKHFLEGKMFC